MDRPVDGLGNTGNLKIINQSKQSHRNEIKVFPWARWRMLHQVEVENINPSSCSGLVMTDDD